MNNALTNKKVIIITAPSGAGKTTIVQHLLLAFPQLGFSVSATNRPQRPDEKDGEDYYFLSTADFLKKIEDGKFLEWEEVYPGHYYGTLTLEVERLWSDDKIIIFDIDVKGSFNLTKILRNECLSIFIKPPSMYVLKERLASRRTESEATLKRRLEKARTELVYSNEFDVVIVNDILEVALKIAEQVVGDYIAKNCVTLQ